MKNNMKNISDVSVRIIRWGIGIFIITLLIILIVVEDRQLAVMEREEQISVLKDERTCRALTFQQLQRAEAQALEEKQEITEEISKNFFTVTYLNCIELTGRDSSLFQAIEDVSGQELELGEVVETIEKK